MQLDAYMYSLAFHWRTSQCYASFLDETTLGTSRTSNWEEVGPANWDLLWNSSGRLVWIQNENLPLGGPVPKPTFYTKLHPRDWENENQVNRRRTTPRRSEFIGGRDQYHGQLWFRIMKMTVTSVWCLAFIHYLIQRPLQHSLSLSPSPASPLKLSW